MYRFEVNWNRNLAMRGEGTAAAIHEMIRGAAIGNFGNVDRCKVGRNGAWPSVDMLLSLAMVDCREEINDKSISGCVQDETGRLSWTVWRVSDNVRIDIAAL